MLNRYMLAAGAALAAGSALSAEPDHLNLQEPVRPGFLEHRTTPVFSLPPLAPEGAESAPSQQSFVIDRVRFLGNSVVATEDLQALAAPFIGRAVSAADIESLRQKATLLYVERGYVNSGALLPTDALERGTLTLHMVEGRLKEIRLRGLDGLDEHYVSDRLARSEDVLNIQTLGERFQLLLGDPLFKRMNARLLPDSERGKAVLDIDVERALPYQLSLAANNYRPVSVGAQNATLSGWIRNLTGYGDTLEASYQGPLGSGHATRTAVGWRVPLNSRGTQLSLNYDAGDSSVIEQQLRPLDIRSRLVGTDIGIAQTVIETLGNKLSIGLNRVERENRTTLLGVPFSFVPGEPSGVSQAKDWRFWQEYSQRWENQVLALRSTFTEGRNNLLDTSATPGPSLDRRYRIWLGQAQYARRVLDNGTQLLLRLNVQQTPHRLLAMEGMSVGGANTVRGYRENQLVRDNGVISNVELDVPVLADAAHKLTVNLAPFFDHGRARNTGEGAEIISSVGLAAHLRWNGMALDIAAASRQYHSLAIAGGSSDLQDKAIHFQLSYNFF